MTSSSSSDIMIWVQEEGGEAATTAFKVTVPPNAIVDHLKKAIKREQELTYASSKLTIKVNGQVQEVDKLVSEITVGKTKAAPIYFTQPPAAQPATGKRIL